MKREKGREAGWEEEEEESEEGKREAKEEGRDEELHRGRIGQVKCKAFSAGELVGFLEVLARWRRQSRVEANPGMTADVSRQIYISP